jgi:hypothetical protein
MKPYKEFPRIAFHSSRFLLLRVHCNKAKTDKVIKEREQAFSSYQLLSHRENSLTVSAVKVFDFLTKTFLKLLIVTGF